jgi:hypothetical protein
MITEELLSKITAMKYLNTKSPVLLFLFILLASKIVAQQYDCTFKPPILKIDFGNASSTSAISVGDLENYSEDDGSCPQDGYYSIISHTSDCFFGNWITLVEDHTPGDIGGKMMIVNASNQPGTFLSYPINNVTANTTYELSVWIINICTGDNGCYPTPPNLNFNLLTSKGASIIVINTGNINPVTGGRWLRYHAQFTTPANTNGIVLKMNDATQGGCGNDFAIDDIELRECVMQKPLIVSAKPVIKESKPVQKETKPVSKPVAKQESSPATLKRTAATISNETVNQKPVDIRPSIKEMPVKVPVPDILLTRSNELVKTIKTPEAEMLIELYDNGEIDGDTVTVYHNNSLLVANAGLSAKPVKFKIKIDKQHPHHELVMVANNLGSIPPNTSLMVITANDQRYELFISSSEQKNARVVIDLKE